MEKEKLINLTEQGLSINGISLSIKKSKSTIRYWLNKFKIKTKNAINKEKKIKVIPNYKKCPRCKNIKSSSEFYKRRNKTELTTYCIKCANNQTIERMRIFKLKCVEYKGGKCQICPYKKCVDALDFHHIDSTKKKFNISHSKSHSFSNLIKKELDKCIMTCSNCHREIHSGITKIPKHLLR